VDGVTLAICASKFEVVLPEMAKLFDALYGMPKLADKYSTHKGPLE
jgi:hypothetical protein